MSSSLTVVISGCHAGGNPSPGLGIARSLRAAFPDAHLIARDTSPRATGLHDAVFDEVWIAPTWEGADLELLRGQLESRLESAWFISGLDDEIGWLAGRPHPRMLLPGASALDQVAKPAIRAHAGLSFLLPEWKAANESHRGLESFCRRHNWRLWLKGPTHEARRVRSWSELCVRRAELESTWGAQGLFLQQHVAGEEVSLAYAAYRGELLEAVWLEKLAVTPEGKVWSGRIETLPEHLRAELTGVLRRLDWTGGGELEFVRDRGGELWLIDWNPRFPAWVHGATLAGHNLPAALLSAAAGHSPAVAQTRAQAHAFTRVVYEVAWRDDLPIEGKPNSTEVDGAVGKHPSGMPELHRKLQRVDQSSEGPVAEALPSDLAVDLAEAARDISETPARVLLARTAVSRFSLAATLKDAHGFGVAYSIKTNPDARLMRLALEHGLLAEAISVEEAAWAVHCGWSRKRVVFNGPVPLQRMDGDLLPLHAAFADDIPTLERYLESPPADVLGVRLRHPAVPSRFGIRLDEPDEFQRLAKVIAGASSELKLGISFHLASSDLGLGRWTACARDLIDWAGAITRLSDRRLSLLDLGGGWTPEDFEAAVVSGLPRLARLVPDVLGPQARVLIEPGKAVAQPSMALLTRVVRVREVTDGRREAILDASIAEVPLIHRFPHRLVRLGARGPDVLDRGRDTLLGRSCMEDDRLDETLALPRDLRPGDLLAICDCGGYDASMAYGFGRGGR